MSFLGLDSVNKKADSGQPESASAPSGSTGPNKAVLTIRAIVGAYLLYLDYQMFEGMMEKQGMEKIAMIAVMAVFAIAAVVLIVLSARGLMKSDGDGDAGN